MVWRKWLILGLCLFWEMAVAAPLPVDDGDVRVVRQGDAWQVDAGFSVPVPPPVAWAVLTDFDGMVRILSNLERSRVVSRQGNVLRVEQKGTAHFGLFSFPFESLREIVLVPGQRIVAKGISGSTRQFESDMRLFAEGGGTRLTYHAEMVPDFWFPSLVGPALLQHEMAEQFSAMVSEMLRRFRE